MKRETVTSARNPLLVHLKKLLAARSYREACGEFAADGTKLLEEAAKWYPGLETVVVQTGVELCPLPEHVRVVEIPESLMRSVSQMEAPQGAIFICRLPEARPAALRPGTLLLDGIQDPGNLGTILRTALGFGLKNIAIIRPAVDSDDPRVVRAKALYTEDESKAQRKSHKNAAVQKLYEDYLGQPNSHKAHELLHTHYVDRSGK